MALCLNTQSLVSKGSVVVVVVRPCGGPGVRLLGCLSLAWPLWGMSRRFLLEPWMPSWKRWP